MHDMSRWVAIQGTNPCTCCPRSTPTRLSFDNVASMINEHSHPRYESMKIIRQIRHHKLFSPPLPRLPDSATNLFVACLRSFCLWRHSFDCSSVSSVQSSYLILRGISTESNYTIDMNTREGGHSLILTPVRPRICRLLWT